jgi:hypothetical protein
MVLAQTQRPMSRTEDLEINPHSSFVIFVELCFSIYLKEVWVFFVILSTLSNFANSQQKHFSDSLLFCI